MQAFLFSKGLKIQAAHGFSAKSNIDQLNNPLHTSLKSTLQALMKNLVQTQKIVPNLIMLIHNVKLEFDTSLCRQWTPDWQVQT